MSTITTINAGDLISSSRTDINNNFSNLNTDKIETSYIDTDTSLTANSDTKIATQKAVKAYVDSGGNVNASETTKGIVEEATDAEVTAGTATGATGAKLFITPAKNLTYLASRLGTGVPPLTVSHNTIFETSGRFTSIVNTGTNSFTTDGLTMDTTSTSGRAAGITWTLFYNSVGDVFSGSPVCTGSLSLTAIGTTGSMYYGLGAVTKDGTGHTYTTDHCGFKVLVTGSVASLYATQADGSTETASSALTTIAVNDQIDVMLKINGTSSIDYYWRKNGAAWSSATNLTANIPNTASNLIQISNSNNSTATQQIWRFQSASYSR